ARLRELFEVRMGEDIEVVVAYAFEHALADNVGIYAAEYILRRLARRGADAGIDEAGAAILVLACPTAFVNSGAHEAGTQNRDADVERSHLCRPAFAHRHNGELRRTIGLHPGR